MSYILDALRRADADRARERAGAPDLHAHERVLSAPADDEALPARQGKAGWMMAAGFAVAVLVAGAWWVMRPAAPQSVVAVGPAPTAPVPVGQAPMAQLPAVQPPVAQPPVAQPPVTQPPVPPAPVAQPPLAQPPLAPPPVVNVAPVPQPVPAPTPAAPPAARPMTPSGPPPGPLSGPAAVGQPRFAPPGTLPPATDARAAGPQAMPGTVTLPAAAPVPAPVPAPAPAPAATVTRTPASVAGADLRPAPAAAGEAAAVPVTPAAAASAPARSLRASELPDALRRELPPLAVGISMYAPEPANRMLVLDGQVVREGQTLQPGLVVERIGERAAVLSIRGQRFELPYR